MENEATKFFIHAHRPSKSICLFDNGTGITKETIISILKNIGYGVQKNEKFSNSYFGLGLMSILELGKSAIILSKTDGNDDLLKLEIDTATIYSEKMGNEPLSSINKYFVIKSIGASEREKYSYLDSDTILGKFDDSFPGSFTEIILKDIDETLFNTIISEEFEKELSKILPLKIAEYTPFLNYIKDDGSFSEWIMKLCNADDKKYCPTIEVFNGIDEEKELTQLYKYFPKFQNDLEFGKADIVYDKIEYGEGKSFAFYYLCSTEDIEDGSSKKDEKDGYDKKDESKETGFWVRNRNFLVKRNDYFNKPGSGKKIIDQPLKKWLFGEIFHSNMTDSLIVTRDEYVWESKTFEEFYNCIKELLSEINKKLRDAWKISKDVTDNFVIPFSNVGTDKDPFQKTQKLLENAGIIKKDNLSEDIQTVFQKLSLLRKPEIENEEKSIINLLSQSKGEILLYEGDEVKVIIDDKIKKEKGFIKQREVANNIITVRISPEIFSNKEVTFLGHKFTVCFVGAIDSEAGISFNYDDKKIYINPFNKDLLKYSITLIDIYIAIELADSISHDKSEMKVIFLSLVSSKLNKYEDGTKDDIFTALRDELSRRI
jgi:uncharacterized Zn ribbon protein